MSVKMPKLFNYRTVDEVAECIDGVGEELYRKLWSFITSETDGENAPLLLPKSSRRING